jgi:RecA-family ATPase
MIAGSESTRKPGVVKATGRLKRLTLPDFEDIALPKRTVEYVLKGAKDGDRNNELLAAAQQFSWAGISLDVSLERLGARAEADGLAQREAESTIRSAYRQAQRNPIDVGDYDRPRFEGGLDLPQPAEHGLRTLLETCFRPGEYVAIGDTFENEDGQHFPTAGFTYSREKLLEILEKRGHINKFLSDPEGLFIRVNPLKRGGKSDADVAAFRHVLVEFDKDKNGNTIPLEVQHKAIHDSKLPVAVLLYSGNRSLHAWVCVDAKNADEWKARRDQIWAYFAGKNITIDENPSRYSRCPDAKRTVREEKIDENGEEITEVRYTQQLLLGSDLGAASWVEWADRDCLLKEEDTLFMLENPEPEKEIVISDWARRSDVAMIDGAMKTNKSWTLLDLAVAFATGGKWLERQCLKGSVYYIDTELRRSTWQKRLRLVCEGYGVSFEDVMRSRMIKPVFLRGGAKVPISQIANELKRKFHNGRLNGCCAIVLDPIYHLYEPDWEENSNEDMSKLSDYLYPIAETTDCAIVFAHHQTKGRQDGKRGIERGSDAGAFGRLVQCSLSISPYKNRYGRSSSLNGRIRTFRRKRSKYSNAKTSLGSRPTTTRTRRKRR